MIRNDFRKKLQSAVSGAPVGGATVLALSALLMAAPAAAQETVAQTGTHTVRRGDTLWDLARTYLGDPFLWPEIYRVNTTIVEDPHWIFPGEVLQLPGAAGAGEQTEIVAMDPGGEDPVTAGGPTIFAQTPRPRTTAAARQGVIGREPFTFVREGEFEAAPFVVPADGLADAGRIVATASLAGIAQTSKRSRIALRDRVYITAPGADTLRPGARLLVFYYGPRLEGLGRVVVPAGIIQVEQPGDGRATTATVVKQFDEIRVEYMLTPLERFTMAPEARPQPVRLGVSGRVAWVQASPVLPNLQRYVVLNTTARDGVRLGDVFTFIRRPRELAEGVQIPRQDLVRARVVRVTDQGTTAIIHDVEQPVLDVGMAARITAKMP